MRRLVYLYPRAWRSQYGAEFGALLEEMDSSPRVVADVVLGAGDAHYQQWQRHFSRRQLRLMGQALGGLLLMGLVVGMTVPPTVPFAVVLVMFLGLIATALHLLLMILGIQLLQEIESFYKGSFCYSERPQGDKPMDVQTFAMIAAGIGVVTTIIYVTLGFFGIKTLQDIRDQMRKRDHEQNT